jgi:hypothetical protein
LNLLTTLEQPTVMTPIDLAGYWWNKGIGRAVVDTDDVMSWLREADLFSQNRLVVPVDRDGMKEFYLENQGCFRWGFDSSSRARAVYGRPSAGRPWLPEVASLELFLAQIVVFEAAIGPAPNSAAACCLPSDVIARCLSGFTRVLDHWSWPAETRFYASETALAFSTCEAEGEGDVCIASHDSSPIKQLLPLVDETTDCWTSICIDGVDHL